jgi:hypothetical protein
VPLVARAGVTHGVEFVVTESHLNRTATSGYVARLVLPDAVCALGDEYGNEFMPSSTRLRRFYQSNPISFLTKHIDIWQGTMVQVVEARLSDL